jgi:hypothetical protein
MAGDWLKMESSTPDKRETLAITEAMGWTDVDITVGKLFRIWRWFDQQTLDGNAPGVTSALLDRVAGAPGLAKAMQSVGWLTLSDGGVTLPNFDRHNGATAKARARNATNQANKRGRAEASPDAGDTRVTERLPREEKRREEKKEVKTLSVSQAKADGPVSVDDSDVAEAAREYNSLAAEWAKPKVSARGLVSLTPKLIRVRSTIQSEIPEFTLAECIRRVRDQEEFFREWQAWTMEWFIGSKRGTFNAVKVWHRSYAKGQPRQKRAEAKAPPRAMQSEVSDLISHVGSKR